MNKIIVILCCLVVAVTSGMTRANASDSLLDWTAIFTEYGAVRSPKSGIDAVFLQENISAGIATDMTALAATGDVVYNGPVASAHDLGNGYVHAALDAQENLIITAGIERLNSSEDTYVEFEFNQGVVGVTSGNPWPIHGSRIIKDCLVRMNFIAGNLSSIELKTWDGSGYSTVSSVLAPFQSGCSIVSASCNFCSGSPIPGLPPSNSDVWDSSYKKVLVPAADSFVQINVNVGRLFGANIDYSSIVIRSPEDIVLGSFRAMGYWGTFRNAPAVQ